MIPREAVIGLSLQLASFLLGYLSLRYLYSIGWLPVLLFSVPLFLASPFYLLRAPWPLPLRLLLSFWILAFPLYHILYYIHDRLLMRPEIVLIPEGFQGRAKIWFGDPAGAAPELENGSYLFRLNSTGELHTSVSPTKFESDSVNDLRRETRQYFRIDPTGRRTALEVRTPDAQPPPPPESIIIFAPGESWDNGRIQAADFYVGTPARILELLKSP